MKIVIFSTLPPPTWLPVILSVISSLNFVYHLSCKFFFHSGFFPQIPPATHLHPLHPVWTLFFTWLTHRASLWMVDPILYLHYLCFLHFNLSTCLSLTHTHVLCHTSMDFHYYHTPHHYLTVLHQPHIPPLTSLCNARVPLVEPYHIVSLETKTAWNSFWPSVYFFIRNLKANIAPAELFLSMKPHPNSSLNHATFFIFHHLKAVSTFTCFFFLKSKVILQNPSNAV